MGEMPIPKVRRPEFAFDTEIPSAWFGGSPFRTHLVNGLNLVFPAGERFFIRSVKHYEGAIDDPELKARVAAFAGQEAQHQRAHMAAFRMLERHGYEVRGWLEWYERIGYEHIEPRVSPLLRLSSTAALEHLTATFGEMALDTELLDTAHPVVQRLLRWHAAEEIEHRDVAYDVLQRVDGRWIVRAVGFVMACALLGYFWASGARHLLRQEPRRERSSERVERREVRAFWYKHGPRFGRLAVSYLKPGFHPRQMGSDALARAWLVEAELA